VKEQKLNEKKSDEVGARPDTFSLDIPQMHRTGDWGLKNVSTNCYKPAEAETI
jgi:hypothetical protein